ncbi:unnamed protein product [Anisakis simplex]|uniref:Uncharacterized protein n=1 Tax=Anisakis simplex TaxID=6269 RepID=A0A0M3JMT9_ANISI|nr:unnamed protein product [Anisakis simplex]
MEKQLDDSRVSRKNIDANRERISSRRWTRRETLDNENWLASKQTLSDINNCRLVEVSDENSVEKSDVFQSDL